MNKLIKGAVTGAAGIALLLGGAGTFAAWNDSLGIGTGNVNAGKLTVTAVDNTATWTDVTPGVAAGTTIDPSSYYFVPGDVIQLKENVLITATGNNLKATLSAVVPAAGGTGTANASSTASGASDAPFVVKASFATGSVTGPGSLTASTNAASGVTTYTVDSDNASTVINVPVTVTISLPDSGTVDNTSQGKSVDLSQIAIDLDQIVPTAAP